MRNAGMSYIVVSVVQKMWNADECSAIKPGAEKSLIWSQKIPLSLGRSRRLESNK